MPSWDPIQYNKFENERLRPAIDLINRIFLKRPKKIYDLGCGTGKITQMLKQKWPDAKIIGIDSSSAMLNQARKLSNEIAWHQADLNEWKPDENVDLLFSNAVFHWIDNHDKLLPRLVSYLKPKGLLAIQVPNNFAAPTHVAIRETVLEGAWRDKLEDKMLVKPIEPTSVYYNYLAPNSEFLDIWETSYLHILSGEQPVLEWIKGSAVRPLTDLLSNKDKINFLNILAKKLETYYPKLKSGITLMEYKRLFMIFKKM